MRPANHAVVPSTAVVASPPIVSARTASEHSVIGLTRANAWTAAGMLSVGTNVELANVSGKTQIRPSDCAVSGSRTARATTAEIHENTYAKPSTSAIAA